MAGFLGFEIAIILILTLANGFFASSEIAIVSSRPSRLQQQIDAGRKSAIIARDLANHPDSFLATIQIGITLINTLMGAFGEASLSEPLAQWLKTMPFIAPYANTLSLVIVVILITYVSLILGELVPKRLALRGAENVAMRSAPIMNTLAKITAPVVTFLTGSANLVLRLLGQGKAVKNEVTEEDIVYMIHEGSTSGTVEKGEEEFINRIFRFTDRTIGSVMKPRTEITAIEVGTPLPEVLKTFSDTGFTRIPIYKDSLDNIVGVLYAKDLLKAQILSNGKRENIDLAALARPPFFVSEYHHVDDLLTTFRRKAIHMAIVIDEYSQVVGLVTMEDLLEELVGEIQDEYDLPENNAIVQRDDGSWLVDGMLDRETVEERIGLKPVDDDAASYHTLAGMILAHLGRIPQIGDTLTIGDFTLEVVDMDGRRIDRVAIKRKKTKEKR